MPTELEEGDADDPPDRVDAAHAAAHVTPSAPTGEDATGTARASAAPGQSIPATGRNAFLHVFIRLRHQKNDKFIMVNRTVPVNAHGRCL